MKKVLIFIFLSVLIFSEPYDNFENLYTGINYLLEKRDDKTEINSLIRLMEITTAKIETSTISRSEKIER